MDDTSDRFDALLRSGARRLTGHQRRLFQAEVTETLCGGSPRAAERRFGWGRETVEKGLCEARRDIRCVENFAARGRRRSEDKDPGLAADVRAIVEPCSYADPELQSSRRYTNLSSREVREALIKKGRPAAELPSERTIRDVLNRMNYRLKRIQKGKPLKKIEETDAIFENVKRVKEEARDDPETLELSMDTKAKVSLGDYSRGGKPGPTRPVRRQGVGPRPAREGEVGPVRDLGGRDRSVDAVVRTARDQRRLGRRSLGVVAEDAEDPRGRQTAGGLPGQRPQELGPADPVPQADGAVRGPVGVGDPLGLLSAVPQQIQPGRAVLVGAGEEVERRAAVRPVDRPRLRRG